MPHKNQFDKRIARFIDEYLKDFNGTRAAECAGYSKKGLAVRASEILKLPYVKKAIEEAQKANRTKAEIDRDKIVRHLKRVAFTPITEFVTWQGQRIDFKNSASIPKELLCLLEGVEQGDKTFKLKYSNRLKAIELLGRHLGIFVDKSEHEHTGKIEVIVTDYRTKK